MICLICGFEGSCRASSNLTHHLNQYHRKHKGYATMRNAAETKKAARRAGRNGNGRDVRSFLHKKTGCSLTTEERDAVLMKYVVKDMEEYSTVESPHFRKMVRLLTGEPDCKFPDRKTLVEAVRRKAEEVKLEIKVRLRGKPLALTCDGWESRAENTTTASHAVWWRMMGSVRE